MPKIIQVKSAFIALTFLAATANANEDLEFRLSTYKSKYLSGESIVVTLVWKNIGKKTLRAEQWRGLPEAVTVFGPDGKPLPYHGVLACGGQRIYFDLKPAEARTETYEISRVYDTIIPGKYRLQSKYHSHAPQAVSSEGVNYWSGTASAAPVEIEIAKPTSTDFPKFRETAKRGDRGAIDFLGVNKDLHAIPVFEMAYKNGDWDARYAASKALSRLGTDDAVAAMGRLIKIGAGLERGVLMQHLGETGNRAAIPLLRGALDDDYVGGTSEQNGRRHKIMTVRKQAATALKSFKISTSESIWRIPVDASYKFPQPND